MTVKRMKFTFEFNKQAENLDFKLRVICHQTNSQESIS